MDDFSKSNKVKFIMFIHFLTNEINEKFEQSIENLIKMKEFEDKEAAGDFHPTEEEVK